MLGDVPMKTQRNGRHKRVEDVSLEVRVARLEEEMARMKTAPLPAADGGWESVVGIDKGNSFFQGMVKAMQRHRAADYSEARAQVRPKKRRRATTASSK